jgi:phosphatidylglycerophosphate synthase
MSALAWDKRIARVVARGLAKTPISPNLATTGGLLIGLAAAYLFSRGDAVSMNWAGLLFMLAVLADHVDGELARSTGRTSSFGHYYDHVAAATSYIGGFVGMGFGLARGDMGPMAIALGLAAGVSIFLIFSLRANMEARHGTDVTEQPSFAGFEIEDTLYLVGPVTWAGWNEPFLTAAGIGTPIFLLWVVRDWFRQRRNADSKAP